MREYLRRHVPLVIAMLVVIAVAASEVGAQPKTPAADDGFGVAARGNVDRVDGKHAVGAGTTKKKRAGKLVATNKQGLLPANIVRPFWWAIAAKPAAFADGQIAWAEVVGKPAGVGYSSAIIYTHPVPLGPGVGSPPFDIINQPNGIDYQFTVIPTEPGVPMVIFNHAVTRNADGTLTHRLQVGNDSATAASGFRIRALAFSEGIAPAKLKRRIKNATVKVKKKGKKKRKWH